jgi:heme A synthase
MSNDESLAIDELRKTIRWLIGGVLGLLAGAAAVGGWVATQENRITSLAEADRFSMSERSEMRGELKAHSSIINAIQKDSAVQSRDLQYIREAVTEIKDSIKIRP